MVNERKEYKKADLYDPADKYYWDIVFDQNMCYDCDTETIYQELIDAGMKPENNNGSEYADEYVYYSSDIS